MVGIENHNVDLDFPSLVLTALVTIIDQSSTIVQILNKVDLRLRKIIKQYLYNNDNNLFKNEQKPEVLKENN